MKAKLPMIARILLGLVFAVFGFMGLFNLMPPPPVMPEKMMTFMTGMMATTYFMPFLKLTETICGVLLLTNSWVPLALVVLAPVTLNIFLVHAFMDPSGLPMAIIIGLIQVYLAFFAEPYAHVIKGLFKRK